GLRQLRTATGAGPGSHRASAGALRGPAGLDRVGLEVLVALLQLLADLSTLLALQEAAFLFLGLGLARRYRHRATVVIDRDHGEEAAVGVAHGAFADVFGHYLDAHLHGGVAGIVDRCEEGHQLADV